MPRFTPRPIRPENVLTGCTVAVTLPTANGLSITHTGRVHTVRWHGITRHFLTQEGAVIFAYDPDAQPRYKISLLDREPEPHSELFGVFA